MDRDQAFTYFEGIKQCTCKVVLPDFPLIAPCLSWQYNDPCWTVIHGHDDDDGDDGDGDDDDDDDDDADDDDDDDDDPTFDSRLDGNF